MRIGDMVKIKTTKGKVIVGRLVENNDSYVEIISKHNKYKTYLTVEIEEIELYE